MKTLDKLLLVKEIITQINFTADLDRGNYDNYTRIYFILEEVKETILEFSLGTVKVLYICYKITSSLI